MPVSLALVLTDVLDCFWTEYCRGGGGGRGETPYSWQVEVRAREVVVLE